MRIRFVTRKFGNVERNSHCDVLHFTPVRVARLFLDCNGVFAIKAYNWSNATDINKYVELRGMDMETVPYLNAWNASSLLGSGSMPDGLSRMA